MNEFLRLEKKALGMGMELYHDHYGYWLKFNDERDSEFRFKSLKAVDAQLKEPYPNWLKRR